MALSERIHLFGIRHHGPGSSRSLIAALEQLNPDMVLVEGPPDGNPMLPLALHEAMQPPVAMLIYAPDEPAYAAHYPFAAFSPEWQAIRYALSHQIPVRLMDLEQSVQMAMYRKMVQEAEQRAEEAAAAESASAEAESASAEAENASTEAESTPAETEPSPDEELPENDGPSTNDGASGEDEPGEGKFTPPPPSANAPAAYETADPLRMLAEAAGYSESEQWWEHMVEQRREAGDVFSAILEAMVALRDAAPPETTPLALCREAAMRQSLRAALNAGYQRIAVVCGAWHTPALLDLGGQEEDARLLADLPRIPVEATWVPWTNARLARGSGYGAGIESPGWYAHLWSTETGIAERWMIRVARLLREEDLDVTPAHVIEAVRLAEALAALRGRPLPGLPELNEAALTVFCFGSPLPMRLIEEKLIIGDALGAVPPETPMAPLQVDFERESRRLKLKPEAYEKVLDLDLRKPFDLERSHLLHRLALLGIPWGQAAGAGLQASARGRGGTFHEVWKLRWQPEFSILLIEAGQWGSTIADAASARVSRTASLAADLISLTGLVEDVLLAELPDAIHHVMTCLQAQAAVSSDVRHLMQALPPLTSVLRYGNVRQTDSAMLTEVVDGLAARIFIGLAGACSGLNDEAAGEMFDELVKVDEAIHRLDSEEYLQPWLRALLNLLDLPNIHGLIAGRACRILHDNHTIPTEETARRLGLGLSTASEPTQSAAWVEGFLRGSGQLLIHDDSLLGVIDGWLSALPEGIFIQLLPLLRRTFATFARPERRSIGERVKRGQVGAFAHPQAVSATPDFDLSRADAVLPIVSRLLGLPEIGEPND